LAEEVGVGPLPEGGDPSGVGSGGGCGVVSRLSTRLAALEHGWENPILVEDLEEDKREYPQLPVGDPGRLVEIEDVSEVGSIFDEDAELGSPISEARSSPVV
jgi:hypothetical protein